MQSYGSSASSLHVCGADAGDPISSEMTSVDNPMAPWKSPSSTNSSTNSSFQTAVEEKETRKEKVKELEQPWFMLYDKDSGCWYRQHPETGEMVWCGEDEHAAAVGGGTGDTCVSRLQAYNSAAFDNSYDNTSAHDTAMLAKGAAEHADIHVDEAGNKYYVNSTTGEAVWYVEEKGVGGEGKGEDEHTAVGGNVEVGTGVATEHEIHVDDATGNKYYVNSTTGEAVWCGDEDRLFEGRQTSTNV
jgi:hypothetical protein